MTELEETKKRLLDFAISCCINLSSAEQEQQFSDIMSDLIDRVECYAKIEVLNEFKE